MFIGWIQCFIESWVLKYGLLGENGKQDQMPGAALGKSKAFLVPCPDVAVRTPCFGLETLL